MENTARVTMVRKFSLLYLLFCATPCLVLPRALHVDAVDIFLSSIYIGFQGKYFFFLFGYVIMSHMLHFYVLYGSLLLACRMGNFFLFICMCFS